MKSIRSEGRGMILGVAATAMLVLSLAACGDDAGDTAQGGDPDPPQEDLLESSEPENLESVDNPEPRGRLPAVSPAELTPYSESTGPGDRFNDPVRRGATSIGELETTILNSHGIRSWAVRRTAVDVLKAMQVQAAYQALLGTRDALIVVRAGLPAGRELSQVDDLLARIDSAIRPYFDR